MAKRRNSSGGAAQEAAGAEVQAQEHDGQAQGGEDEGVAVEQALARHHREGPEVEERRSRRPASRGRWRAAMGWAAKKAATGRPPTAAPLARPETTPTAPCAGSPAGRSSRQPRRSTGAHEKHPGRDRRPRRVRRPSPRPRARPAGRRRGSPRRERRRAASRWSPRIDAHCGAVSAMSKRITAGTSAHRVVTSEAARDHQRREAEARVAAHEGRAERPPARASPRRGGRGRAAPQTVMSAASMPGHGDGLLHGVAAEGLAQLLVDEGLDEGGAAVLHLVADRGRAGPRSGRPWCAPRRPGGRRPGRCRRSTRGRDSSVPTKLSSYQSVEFRFSAPHW